jgi:hypothetical protein
MCGVYTVYTTDATYPGTTETVFVELKAPTGQSIAITKIAISMKELYTDHLVRARVYRASTAGTGGTSATIVDHNPETPAAGTTAKVRTTTASFTKGTTSDVLLDTATHIRSSFEWIARDFNDYLWSDEDGYLELTIIVSSGSQNMTAQVWFIE